MNTKREIKHGWEVEWCPSVRTFEDGSMDPSSVEYHSKDFADKAKAEAFSKTKLAVDVFGSVRITEFRREPISPEYPWHTHKEYVSDPFYVENYSAK